MRIIFSIFILVLSATGVLAHSKTNKMVPENGAVIEDIPEFIELSFDKDIRLTKIEVVFDNETKELDLNAKTVFSDEFSIPFLGVGNGKYQVNWRGLAKDGHTMKGSFSFEVK